MIKTIELKFGRSAQASAEVIECTPITVFVGPNNSGKSQVLEEIFRCSQNGTTDSSNKILSKFTFGSFSEEDAKERIKLLTLTPTVMEVTSLSKGQIIVGKGSNRLSVMGDHLLNLFKRPDTNLSSYCAFFVQFNTLILNGKNRINLVEQQPGGDLLQPPHNSFQTLFRDDLKRASIRKIVFDAFGQYFVIDPTNHGHFRIGLSSVAPPSNEIERGLSNASLAFHAACDPISFASDGVKAFTGMITEIVAGDPLLLLIDEPEAFLHPSLAFKLGKEIATVSKGSMKRLFVATHSPNFVMGCIQSGAPVTIVRLTYTNRSATSRVLPNDDILRLMRNPLLRSIGVVSGLFYESVVVTEGDSDRAFYNEVNERLLGEVSNRGIPNCQFLNAQNKQTVRTIIRPLRELGIPAAGIVDIDVLKDGGSDWTSLLESAFVPPIDRESLSIVRSRLAKSFEVTGKKMKQDGGITLLGKEDREAAQNLFEKLAEYGIFVVANGELESWLKELQVTGHGPTWLIAVFEKMGEDPESGNYLKPSNDDVWDFLDRIREWCLNPNRKGIPS
jgi:ABC-type cobalamin/Fe3+-siderophores transport system ATPase subunit